MAEWDRVEERRMDHGVVRIFVTEKGGRYTHYDCERRLKAASNAFSRWFSRSLRTATVWNDADMNESELRDLRWALDDMLTYVGAASAELDRIEGVNRKAERIAALRNVKGRTAEEAALYLAKADAMECDHG